MAQRLPQSKPIYRSGLLASRSKRSLETGIDRRYRDRDTLHDSPIDWRSDGNSDSEIEDFPAFHSRIDCARTSSMVFADLNVAPRSQDNLQKLEQERIQAEKERDLEIWERKIERLERVHERHRKNIDHPGPLRRLQISSKPHKNEILCQDDIDNDIRPLLLEPSEQEMGDKKEKFRSGEFQEKPFKMRMGKDEERDSDEGSCYC